MTFDTAFCMKHKKANLFLKHINIADPHNRLQGITMRDWYCFIEMVFSPNVKKNNIKKTFFNYKILMQIRIVWKQTENNSRKYL